MNQLNKTYQGDISLVSLLSPEVSLGWGISCENFSHPSWNILVRALIRANLIQNHTPINVIKISDLQFLTLNDITEIKHAGKIRIQHLILELQQVKASISEEIMHENTAKEKMQDEHAEAFEHEVLSDNSSKIPIETSLVIRMVTSSDWRIEFRSEFGFEFNELEFDDETIERNLKILAARLDGLTLDSIGREFGVTRERIRQIVNKLIDRAQNLTDDTNVDLWSLYEQKLELLKNAPKIKLVEEVNSIELKARKVINNNPGISIADLSNIIQVESSYLISILSKNSKKFIFTEEKFNSNVSNFTDEDIFEALRFAEAFESPINRNLYDDLVERGIINGPGSQTVMKRFKTWNNACKLAEVSHNESVRETYESLWTKDEMLNFLIEFLKNRSFGVGINSYDEWRNETLTNAPSGAHVRNIFNTWINAKNEALKKMYLDKVSPELI